MMRKVGGAFTGLVIVFAVAAAAAVRCESTGSSLVKLLPGGGEIKGWIKDGEHLSYTAENLWEYINGSAENFLTYDFREVVVQDYKRDPGRALKVEIYGHGSPLMAFGIYSQYRGPDLNFYDIGNEGFGDAYSLHFWKGDCYVKISVFDESEERAGEMKAFAQAVAARIENAGTVPAGLACFPGEGLVEKSITYVTVGALGSGRLPPAFIADYRSGDDSGRLYLFPLDDGKESREIFDRYSEEIGAEVKDGNVGDKKYLKGVCDHPYRGKMLLFQYGVWMGVLTGFKETADIKDDLLERAVERIAGLCE